jgi:hypothetical protein
MYQSAQMVTVWLPNRDAGWAMPAAEPHDSGWVEGGRRTMHELAVAIAASGRRVEFRGEMSLPVLEELVSAAGGARVELPDAPRLPEAGDVVIVNEGVADPRVYARLALSPARAILLVLGPLGMFGWPFVEDAAWTRPDYDTMDPASLARPEHFAGAAALGFELWSHTPAFARAAAEGGAECVLVGRGQPAAFPRPRPAGDRDIDVLMLDRTHWPALSQRVRSHFAAAGIEVTTLPVSPHAAVLEALGRTRVFVHPARAEALARIGTEARAMGAVTVVLRSNPFAMPADGSVAVDSVEEIPRVVANLLADRETGTGRAVESARAEVAWEPYVERVAAALDSRPPPDPGRAARAGLGAALRGDPDAAVTALETDLARHRAWLESVQGSLSWRLTAPLRRARRAVRRVP